MEDKESYYYVYFEFQFTDETQEPYTGNGNIAIALASESFLPGTVKNVIKESVLSDKESILFKMKEGCDLMITIQSVITLDKIGFDDAMNPVTPVSVGYKFSLGLRVTRDHREKRNILLEI